MKILRILLLVILAGNIFAANIAVAHNSLTESNPADGAVLANSPESIELNFSDATYLESLELLTGDTVVVLEFASSITASTYFNVPLPLLQSGEYQVRWLVIGYDTHEIRGEFAFTVLSTESTE